MANPIEIDWGTSPEPQQSKAPIEIEWGDIPNQPQVDKEQKLPRGSVSDALLGGLVGGAQGIANIGALPGRALGGLYSLWTDKPNPSPSYDITEYAPRSKAAQTSEHIAEFVSPFALGPLGLVGKTARIGKALTAYEKLNAVFENAKSRESQLKAHAAHEFSLSNPDRLNLQANELQKKILEGKDFLRANPEENLSNRLPAPSGEHISQLADQGYAAALRNAQYNLYHGENFPAAIAERIVEHIEGRENPITKKMEGGLRRSVGNQYDKLETDLRDKNIQITHRPDTQKAIEAVKESLPNIPGAAQKQAVEKYIKQLTHTQEINASDFLKNYRILKGQARRANEAAYTHGTPLDVQEQWKVKGESLSLAAAEMKKAMDNQLGKDFSKRLSSIDKVYATHIAPLAKNRAYLMMREHGQAPANFAQKISGATPKAKKLNFTLNMLMKRDPYLQKLTLGQQFAHRPEALIEPNKLVEHYSNLNPEIKNIRDRIMQAQSRLEPAKQLSFQQQQESKAVEQSFKDSKQVQEQRIKTQNDIKQWENDIKRMDELEKEMRI